MDALAREGVRFIRIYPEAMPTVPARNSIFSGRRGVPLSRLARLPGPARAARAGSRWTDVAPQLHAASCAGRGTGPATPPTTRSWASPRPTRASATASTASPRRGGQLGGRSGRGVRARAAPLAAPRHGGARRPGSGCASTWPTAATRHDETRSFAARVFRDGVRLLEAGARHRPFALVVDTFQPHEPWTPPRKYLDMYGDPDYRGPEPAMPRYATVGSYLHGPSARAAARRGCRPCTRPRSR